jgi:hypothetical protein
MSPVFHVAANAAVALSNAASTTAARHATRRVIRPFLRVPERNLISATSYFSGGSNASAHLE